MASSFEGFRSSKMSFSPALLEKLRKQGRLRVLPPISSTGRRENEGLPCSSPRKSPESVRSSAERENVDSSSKETWNMGRSTEDKKSPEQSSMTERHLSIQSAEEQEDTLRQLKLVKIYHKKHDLTELSGLTAKWLRVSQEAVEELYRFVGEPKPSMEQFLRSLNIPLDLIQYNPEEEDFY